MTNSISRVIEIKAYDQKVQINIDNHFLESIKLRFKFTGGFNINSLKSLLPESTVIKDRPNNVFVLIKNNCRRALYLYCEKKKLIFVLEENSKTREYDTLKTVYPSTCSKWVDNWLNKTPRYERVIFSDYIRDIGLQVD